MAQLFSPRADRRLRLTLAGSITALVALAGWASGLVDPSIPRLAAKVPVQPVPFSHALHAGRAGLDCRYCHHTVERAPSAGMPPMHTCMGCHLALSPPPPMPYALVWTLQGGLPDHSHFDHGRHAAAGVGCSDCHGDVAAMDRTVAPIRHSMAFCLDCHRDPADRLRPADRITDASWTPEPGAVGRARMRAAGIDPDRLDDCSVCHR